MRIRGKGIVGGMRAGHDGRDRGRPVTERNRGGTDQMTGYEVRVGIDTETGEGATRRRSPGEAGHDHQNDEREARRGPQRNGITHHSRDHEVQILSRKGRPGGHPLNPTSLDTNEPGSAPLLNHHHYLARPHPRPAPITNQLIPSTQEKERPASHHLRNQSQSTETPTLAPRRHHNPEAAASLPTVQRWTTTFPKAMTRH